MFLWDRFWVAIAPIALAKSRSERSPSCSAPCSQCLSRDALLSTIADGPASYRISCRPCHLLLALLIPVPHHIRCPRAFLPRLIGL